MQKRLLKKQREFMADKLMDLGNLAGGALLFGQAFSGFPFNIRIALIGMVAMVSTYLWAIYMIGGEE